MLEMVLMAALCQNPIQVQVTRSHRRCLPPIHNNYPPAWNPATSKPIPRVTISRTYVPRYRAAPQLIINPYYRKEIPEKKPTNAEFNIRPGETSVQAGYRMWYGEP